MHDLARLIVHLHLLLRIAIGLEHVYLGYHVVGQLMGELLDGLHLARFHDLAVLLLQLGHSCGTGAAGTLIAADADALDVAQLLQRLQHDHHHDCRAVGVGDDATRTYQGILGITLGHHQGHVVVHAEGTRIVDHHAAIAGDVVGILFRRTCTCRGECDVDVLKVIAMLQQFHFDVLTLKTVLSPCRTIRTEEYQLVHRELSFIEQSQKLLPYGATCTYNCYFHKP